MIRNQFLRTLTRVSLVCLFPPSGLDKIYNRKQAMAQAASGPLPDPSLLLDLGIAVELLAPAMIVAEKRDREAAVVLAGFCAVTAVMYHQFWTYDDLMAQNQKSEGREHLWEFLKNFGLVAGLVMVASEPRPKPRPAPPVKRRPAPNPAPHGPGAAEDPLHVLPLRAPRRRPWRRAPPGPISGRGSTPSVTSEAGFEPVGGSSMFIETEQTPNPATLKFLPGHPPPVMAEGTLDIRDAAGAERSPLAHALFSVEGVSGVFFGADFVSVTKSGGEWAWIKPAILGAIMEHFTSGAPLLEAGGAESHAADGDEFFDDADIDTVDTIKDLIETRVRPAVAGDGGDITFKGVQGRHRVPDDEGRLRGLPLLDRDAEERHPESVEALRAGSSRRRADLIGRVGGARSQERRQSAASPSHRVTARAAHTGTRRR